MVSNGGLGPNGVEVGSQDQRSQIGTFTIAPRHGRVKLINANSVFTFGAYVRQDQYQLLPERQSLRRPHAGFATIHRGPGPQPQTCWGPCELLLRQSASTQNLKIGSLTYRQTFITEWDTFGLVDPTANAPCLNPDGSFNTNPGITNPNCPGPLQQNPAFVPLLACYDLTRTAPLPASDGCPHSTSGEYLFYGHAQY